MADIPTSAGDGPAIVVDSSRTVPVEEGSGTAVSPSHDGHLDVPGRERSYSDAGSAISSVSTIGPPRQEPEVELTGADVRRVPDPLAPNAMNVRDYLVDGHNPFAFTPGQLGNIIHPKSLPAFYALGGPDGIAAGLLSNPVTGLDPNENEIPSEKSISFTDAVSSAGEGHYQPRQEDTGVYMPSDLPARLTASADADSKLKAEQEKKSFFSKLFTSSKAATPKTFKPADVCDFSTFSSRKHVFSDNHLPERRTKSLLELILAGFKDMIIIVLSGAAVISLALGLYQTFGQPHKPGEPSVEWVEGVAIIVAIVIVIGVSAGNDWQKERQFAALNKKKANHNVQVRRGGEVFEISVYDIMAGDLVLISTGDILPVDGVVIEAHDLQCDESPATGESDTIVKMNGYEAYKAIMAGASLKKVDPFIVAGSHVVKGSGLYMATTTGIFSQHGKTIAKLNEDSEATPLQQKLNRMTEFISKFAGAAFLILFIVLFLKFCVQLKGSTATPAEKGQNFIRILIVSITIAVVAIPEGLPLAVTLALAFATTRMLKDNNLVREIKSCETMGNVSAICSDKTGTLTQNVMTVVKARLSSFEVDLESSTDEDANEAGSGDVTVYRDGSFVNDMNKFVRSVLFESIVYNSTASSIQKEGKTTFSGSKTETALIEFCAGYLGLTDLEGERSKGSYSKIYPFDSAVKCMGVVMKKPDGTGYRLYVKGASEILFKFCTHRIAGALKDPSSDRGNVKSLSEHHKQNVTGYIGRMADQSLRTIALIYKDLDDWSEEDGSKSIFDHLTGSTFIGVVGIRDPLRPGVKEAIADCHTARVVVRMVTGDNIRTAKAIARQCGILTTDDEEAAMEGPDFRKLSREQMKQILPKLRVLARSSPADKEILVEVLKEMGEIVAVTGDGTNDAPALKKANVGFSMGIAGTEVAKDASDIIIMDDNFTSIRQALLWGRAVNDAVKKFLQFQLSVNVTAVALTFITAVASSTEESVLNAVQLLWVNLVMDTLAALALATDPPAPTLLKRRPEKLHAFLITPAMAKMIFWQSVFQLAVTLTLHFAGASILDYDLSDKEQKLHLSTLVFNTFVWMQIFNQLNSRKLDRNPNVFEGITRNWLFILISVLVIGLQTMIIFVGGVAFSVVRLSGKEWAISVILGFLSLPIGAAVRLWCPDPKFWRFNPDYVSRKHAARLAVDESESSEFTVFGHRVNYHRPQRGLRTHRIFGAFHSSSEPEQQQPPTYSHAAAGVLIGSNVASPFVGNHPQAPAPRSTKS